LIITTSLEKTLSKNCTSYYHHAWTLAGGSYTFTTMSMKKESAHATVMTTAKAIAIRLFEKLGGESAILSALPPAPSNIVNNVPSTDPSEKAYDTQ
jgi:hypothetical protein